ncbi:hypothetical protein LO80_03355 [Candidatus Francisella endociliophora]|uniref:Uncharacterized protein n=1 Tax=Candidatus Francisella endociliophora TaxID=653937 RepID=A0A097ENF5_9GAMM|nr:hypothetical protein [Francisella sp. FSC1006]AIT09098.1 hypothetical protein LO80_03355 [Francisella sp. FSC1006]
MIKDCRDCKFCKLADDGVFKPVMRCTLFGSITSIARNHECGLDKAKYFVPKESIFKIIYKFIFGAK